MIIDGVLSVNIAEIFARGAGKLVGIDLSPAMIEAARKLAQAKNIPPDNYSFDGKCRVIGVLFHILKKKYFDSNSQFLSH